VRVEGEAAAALPVPLGVIDIEFASGAHMRVTGQVDAATLSAITTALLTKDRRR
jgi:hypothetical protein